MKNYTIKFSEIKDNNFRLTGSKGMSLAAMMNAGFTVPDGFVVTTKGFSAFLKHNDLSNLLTEKMFTKEESAVLRERIKSSELPKEITDEIFELVEEFPQNTYFAVRSSSVGEDSECFSFAGQQDSFLNVTGEKSIVKSVLECFSSLFTDRAILYRIQNNIKIARIAVVIQKMIPAHISGVMFTCDPVSGNRDIISLEAGFGLGKAIVSGIVRPDLFKVNKNGLIIEGRVINKKETALLPLSEGGTTKVDIPKEHREDSAISDETVIKLAKTGVELEKFFGAPQDIEWCMDSDNIYIVQSRPITTLFPTPSYTPDDGGLHSYFSFGHGQMMLDPVSPMGISILKLIIPANIKAGSQNECKYLYSAAGRIYVDVSTLLKSGFVKKKLTLFLEDINPLMGKALYKLASRQDFKKRTKKIKNDVLRLLVYLFTGIFKIILNYFSKDTEGALGRINNLVRLSISDMASEIEASSLNIKKLELARAKINLHSNLNEILPLFVPGVISFKYLCKLEQKHLGHIDYTNKIVMGFEGNITSKIGMMVGDMADMVRKSDVLKNELLSESYKTLISRINALDDFSEFKKLFNDFIKQYGMRCAAEIDIATERWSENPEPIAKAIMSIVETAEPNAHNLRNEKNKEEAKKAEEAFLAEVSEKAGKMAVKKIKKLIKTCREMMPAREHPKYLIVNKMMIFRELILEEALKLVSANLLETKNDVFYCDYWEFVDAIKNETSLKELVKARKEEYESYKKLKPPYVMTSDGEEISASYKKSAPLMGVGVSSGIYEGTARVVTNPNECVVNKGEIIVARFSDPGWTPLFINAGGLITEIGGMLTHGTIVAREYGIPAVVGVIDATIKIKTGDRIRIDGNNGYIEFVRETVDEG